MNDIEIALKEVAIILDEENFHLVLSSGRQLTEYSLSPKHAKRLLMLLQLNIDLYEKLFGELKTSLPVAKKDTGQQKKIGF